MYFRVFLLCSFLYLSSAVVPLVFAQNANQSFLTAHGDFFHLLLPERSDIQLGYRYEPGVEQDGGPGEFDLNRFSVEAEVPWALSRDRFLRWGITYEARLYDFKGESAEALEDDLTLHKVAGRFGLGRFITDNLLLTGDMTLGLYSDFDESLDSDDLQLYGGGMFVYRLNPGAQIILGVAYTEDFDDQPVIPLIGLRLLREDGRLSISITAPLEARIGYKTSESVELFARGSIYGNEFRVSKAEDRFNVHVHDSLVGIGVLVWLGRHFSLELEGGVSVGSELDFKTDRVDVFDGDLDPGGFLAVQLGIAL